MISCVEIQLGTLYLEELLQKIVGESGVSIKNNRMRHAMKLEDLIHENLSHNGGYKWVLKRKEMSILGNMISYLHDE
jgi:hypothetical protein